MEESKRRKKIFNLSISAFILMALFLVVYLITILSGSSSFFKESSEKNALLNFEVDIEKTVALVEEHYNNLYQIAERMKYADSREAVEEIMESYIGSDQFGDLRYYSQGNSYAANGLLIERETSAAEHIEYLSSLSIRGCTPVYYDKPMELDCLAFFVPIRGSQYIDGVLSIVPARNVISLGTVLNEKSVAAALIAPDGRVLAEAVDDSFAKTIGNNLYDFIDTLTNGKTDSALVSEAVMKAEKSACGINTNGVNYTVAITPIASFDDNVLLLSLSESEGLIAPEVSYIRHIVNLLIIALVALASGFVYAVLYYKKAKRAIAEATLVDSKLDCPNAEQFKLNAKDQLTIYRRKYSIAVLSIRNFLYISETFGEDGSTEILKNIIKIIQGLTKNEESYGYAGDGKFLLLMLNPNSHAISDKIKLIETILNRNDMLKEKGIKIRFAAGVYNVVSSHRRSVQEMIDCANTACGFSEDNTKNVYTLFTEEVRAEIERNERIEAVMESALANRDFRLFLQPKYDVQHDCIESAEALVRWFDTEKGEYKFPGEFIPLFETNGFIEKLDHFVYIEVLEYLSNAAKRGEKVVPIAVNVSRVTATSPDFINFYVGNKKKYGIPDNFVTLELTESFAMEDYDKISTIITALHNSGMRCSIDDFGSGYSSFSILKQINVDELKLDSVFMKRGIDVKRDDKLLQSIIDLAKFMNMRVVQEGVETKELFDKVIAMGCDVIQGYYYAKAIPLEEFRIFITTNTSIKYKSKVK